MVILLNGKTFEATLPDMTTTSVMAMVTTNMTGHPPLHEGTEGSLGGGLDDEMKMIGHQTEAEDAYGKFSLRHLQQVEERRVVGVFVKDDCAAVATVQDVVGMARQLSARNPRHGDVRY